MTLLHITPLYAGLAGVLLALLGMNVTYHWVRVVVTRDKEPEYLKRAENILSSFIEFVPLTLALLVMIEMRGAPQEILHILGSTLLVGRIMHAVAMHDFSLSNPMRAIGAQLTYLVLLIASFACLYLYALMGI
ncbi:MAG: hypothetical protein EBZ69_05485 [Alphaproteobacteria bacterium]|nr:hypothetical protein [Alphaproteobacteria bacterium]NDC56244.1 hypothetical protein [Alphaproteobacteria bacterium]NDG04392.1 hypothetical protein [Alphaproteobacteria bacterium]